MPWDGVDFGLIIELIILEVLLTEGLNVYVDGLAKVELWPFINTGSSNSIWVSVGDFVVVLMVEKRDGLVKVLL